MAGQPGAWAPTIILFLLVDMSECVKDVIDK